MDNLGGGVDYWLNRIFTTIFKSFMPMQALKVSSSTGTGTGSGKGAAGSSGSGDGDGNRKRPHSTNDDTFGPPADGKRRKTLLHALVAQFILLMELDSGMNRHHIHSWLQDLGVTEITTQELRSAVGRRLSWAHPRLFRQWRNQPSVQTVSSNTMHVNTISGTNNYFQSATNVPSTTPASPVAPEEEVKEDAVVIPPPENAAADLDDLIPPPDADQVEPGEAGESNA
jgi:hypothetical protein